MSVANNNIPHNYLNKMLFDNLKNN